MFVKIKINHQECQHSEDCEITYDFVVSIACGYWRHDYTVTYIHESGKSGALSFGGPGIKADEGLTINVAHTGGA